MGPQILKRFYSCTIESILTGCIAAWYGNCSASDRRALWFSTSLGPSFLLSRKLYTRQCQGKALQIVKNSLLPHGKWYRSAKSRSKRFLNSFYPQAIRLLNS
jgi:hypothetical protein